MMTGEITTEVHINVHYYHISEKGIMDEVRLNYPEGTDMSEMAKLWAKRGFETLVGSLIYWKIVDYQKSGKLRECFTQDEIKRLEKLDEAHGLKIKISW